MPRLLSSAEIIEIRERVHPDVHDDSCKACSLFSTMAAMILLIDMRADFDPDQPRDESGKWTSSGGGDSSGGGGVVPLSETDSTGSVDDKVREAVETRAVGQAAIDNPTMSLKDFGNSPETFNQFVATSAKSNVASDIATRMGTKYDDKLITGGYVGMGQWPAPATPVDQLLDHDSVWVKEGDSLTYVGAEDSVFGKQYLDEAPSTNSLGDTETMRGDDPRVAQWLREESVSKLVTNWAETSNDHSVVSMAMQESAIKEFNLTGTAKWDGDGEDTDTMKQDMAEGTQKELDKNGDMYQAFLRAQYDNTQQFFKDNGITQVTAYRGFDFSDVGEFSEGSQTLPDWADAENADETDDENYTWNADIPLRPLSSFSYDPDSALNFSGGEGTETGVVIGGVVPVSRVLSTAVTGVGCLGEREVVLLGGTDKWTIR
jgi:hypothetical protein